MGLERVGSAHTAPAPIDTVPAQGTGQTRPAIPAVSPQTQWGGQHPRVSTQPLPVGDETSIVVSSQTSLAETSIMLVSSVGHWVRGKITCTILC